MKNVKLTPNKRKIVEAILYLIGEAKSKGLSLTQYEIVKSVFIGDYFHLKKFGRPITFDNYSALEFGPAPETVYDMLKPDFSELSDDGEQLPLWSWRTVSRTTREYFDVDREFNKRRLSETDVDELSSALSLVKKLGFGGVVDFTHEMDAYKLAWASRGSKKSKRMDYHLLTEERDIEFAQELEYASRFS